MSRTPLLPALAGTLAGAPLSVRAPIDGRGGARATLAIASGAVRSRSSGPFWIVVGAARDAAVHARLGEHAPGHVGADRTGQRLTWRVDTTSPGDGAAAPEGARTCPRAARR